MHGRVDNSSDLGKAGWIDESLDVDIQGVRDGV